jgi:hypothetical protein
MENNIARIFAIILINLPPNVNARTITVTLTVADNDIILEFKKIAILLHYLRKFKKKYSHPDIAEKFLIFALFTTIIYSYIALFRISVFT